MLAPLLFALLAAPPADLEPSFDLFPRAPAGPVKIVPDLWPLKGFDPPADPAPLDIVGEVGGAFRPGFPVTFTLTGPDTLSETGDPNPFTDYVLTARFAERLGPMVGGLRTAPSYRVSEVRGYFAADAAAADTGADTGNKWRVHFRPATEGFWGAPSPVLKYSLELTKDGAPVAAAAGELEIARPDYGGDPDALPLLPGLTIPPVKFPAPAPLVARGGRLWRDFAPFYKVGANSPENLLAFADFDGTRNLQRRENLRPKEAHSDQLHRFAPHLSDWTEGDPTWGDGKGKGIIGALNYLAGAGVNAVYFVTYNIAGDGRDVWPYHTPEKGGPDDRTRFDVSKLDQWDVVFSHADRLGIALHVVLTETENESLFEHRDGPGADFDKTGVPFADTRKLYYRELIARFAHHPGLFWNLGEEQGGGGETGDGAPVTGPQLLAFAEYIKSADPYDRPVVVHTHPPDQSKVYTPLLGSPQIDGVSLQLNPMEQSAAQTRRWLARSAAAGEPWFACLDEIGPASDGVLPDAADGAADNHRRVRRALWANLLSGGSGVEWYFGYKYDHNDLDLEDFRSRADVWRFSKLAREFAEREGLHKYEPADDLVDADGVLVAVRPKSPGDRRAGGDRAVPFAALAYLPAGTAGVRLPVPPTGRGNGPHPVRWFDPAAGGDWRAGSVESVAGGAAADLGDPPGGDRSKDWVVKVGGPAD